MCISKVDREEAVETGRRAVRAALAGISGKMIIFKRISQNPYKIDYELGDVGLVANAESCIKRDMIIDNTRMSDKFKDYIAPLIEGEVVLNTDHGIIKMANFKKVLVK